MYLKGSKWSMRRRMRKRSSPWRIIFLGAIILGLLYVNQVVVPAMPSPFIPTVTITQHALDQCSAQVAQTLYQELEP
jgi:type IV secretory pathway TrbF-like protein